MSGEKTFDKSNREANEAADRLKCRLEKMNIETNKILEMACELQETYSESQKLEREPNSKQKVKE